MKVLVIGLRNEQLLKLRSMFPKLNIVGINSDASNDRPLKNMKEFTKIFSMTKFTSHDTHRHYRKEPGYQMLSGGFSSLVQLFHSSWN